MQMQKAVNKKICNLAEGLLRNAKQVSPRFDENIIHQLRTSFKKLRALLRWQNNNKKILKPVKEIYDIAGEIRNAQIVLKNTIATKNELPEFFAWLDSSINHYKGEWGKIFQPKVLNTLLKKIKKVKVKEEFNRFFFSKRIKKIKRLLQASFISDDTLHEIRKMIKDMQYVSELFQKINKEKNGYSKKNKDIKYLSEVLGEYIDKYVELILLQTYRMNEKNKTVLKRIIQVQQNWEHEKDAQKKQLVKLVKGKIT